MDERDSKYLEKIFIITAEVERLKGENRNLKHDYAEYQNDSTGNIISLKAKLKIAVTALGKIKPAKNISPARAMEIAKQALDKIKGEDGP